MKDRSSSFCHQPTKIMDCRLASVPFYSRMTAMPFYQCASPRHGPSRRAKDLFVDANGVPLA
jgi:hypothetical protein